MLYPSNKARRTWSDRRILMLVALSTLIVSVIWRLPEEAAYLGAKTGEILFALTLALATTYVLRPAVRALVRLPGFGDTPKGRTLATLLVFIGCGILLYVVFLLSFRPVAEDIRGLVPQTPQARAEMIVQWRAKLAAAMEQYKDFLPPAVNDPNFLSQRATMAANQAFQWLRHQSSHLGFLVELLLVPVLAFYFLADGPAIRREARLLVPAPWRARLSRMGEHFDYVLDGYVRGQVWMCVIAWILVTAVLLILQVPHAVTLGLIAGVTRAVPVVGPLLGALPLLLVCLVYKSVETTSILLFAFIMMHFLESKVLLPKIVGHHVDLHPVSVIISLLIGMEFFGFIGVFLAVPIAAVLKIVLAEFHESQERKQFGPLEIAVSTNGTHAAAREYEEERADLN